MEEQRQWKNKDNGRTKTMEEQRQWNVNERNFIGFFVNKKKHVKVYSNMT